MGSAGSLRERCELRWWDLGRSPSRHGIWCLFSLKIWHQVATISIIFLRINRPHFARLNSEDKSEQSQKYLGRQCLPLPLIKSAYVNIDNWWKALAECEPLPKLASFLLLHWQTVLKCSNVQCAVWCDLFYVKVISFVDRARLSSVHSVHSLTGGPTTFQAPCTTEQTWKLSLS